MAAPNKFDRDDWQSVIFLTFGLWGWSLAIAEQFSGDTVGNVVANIGMWAGAATLIVLVSKYYRKD